MGTGMKQHSLPPCLPVARMEAPLGTVKSWIRRGLAKLKGCLES